MALNLQTFKTRTLTAIVFVVIMLGGLLINQWTFLVLFSVIHYGCWIEYQKLITLIDNDYKNISPFHKYGIRLLGFGFMLWVTTDAFKIGDVALYEIGWWLLIVMLIALPIMEIVVSRQFNLKNLGYSFLGLLYISISLGLLLNIRCGPAGSKDSLFFGQEFMLVVGEVICLMIIASLWINDTMAYIVGSLIGKTPFSSISPKKTWEGTIGGAILAVAAVTLTNYLINDAFISALCISSITVVFGIMGDLFESKLKRLANVKDSGSIMPGHGGFLDRFDSLLFASPFVWLYVRLFM
jgi:phosphatidate cytidylyltransferase